MRYLFFSISFLWILGVSAAETERYEQLLKEGNALYESGEYDSARLSYSMIINAGYESFLLYYNMGNACYKSGAIASAILYYEKALKLYPSEADATFNLNLARTQIIDKIEEVEPAFIDRAWQNFSGALSVQSWVVLLLIFISLSTVLFAVFLFSEQSFWRRIGFFPALFFTFTSLLMFFAAHTTYGRLMNDSHAIVFSPTLEVKAEPRASSSNLFVIHEGTKVGLLESKEGWKRIALPDGNEGWVPEEDIVPF
jgi:tetratricopeptide (TPR) repeat protein